MTGDVKYSRLRTDGESTEYTDYREAAPACTVNKVAGIASCILVTLCVFLLIATAKILEENKFLQSQYTNYTSSYSFGVASSLQLDLFEKQCCSFQTNYSCLCCPNTPALMNATFASFVAVLKMYVNTKFILYMGNVAANRNDAIHTYTYFSEFINRSEVDIPVFPTLGLYDRPEQVADFPLYYSELYESWQYLINCFDCPLAPNLEGVKKTIRSGGYYSISTTYGLRVISVNTNLFLLSANREEREEAANQLIWLDSILIAARDAHQSKILIGGSAPGLSSADILTRKANTATPAVVSDWDPVFQYKFTELMDKFQFRFSAVLLGGVEYELVRKLGTQYAVLTPPCSPLHCSNPVFRTAFLSERDFELLDLHQYYSPIEFFTRVNKTPKYMFDYSYERIIFGSEQARGPVYLNTYSISLLYDKLVSAFATSNWAELVYSKEINTRTGYTSPLVTYCTTEYSNKTQQVKCLHKYKYQLAASQVT